MRCSRDTAGSTGPSGAGIAALEGTPFVFGQTTPDAGVLAGLDGPFQAGLNHLAATAHCLRLLDLEKCRASVPDGEEQLWVFLQAGRPVTPAHEVLGSLNRGPGGPGGSALCVVSLSSGEAVSVTVTVRGPTPTAANRSHVPSTGRLSRPRGAERHCTLPNVTASCTVQTSQLTMSGQGCLRPFLWPTLEVCHKHAPDTRVSVADNWCRQIACAAVSAR